MNHKRCIRFKIFPSGLSQHNQALWMIKSLIRCLRQINRNTAIAPVTASILKFDSTVNIAKGSRPRARWRSFGRTKPCSGALSVSPAVLDLNQPIFIWRLVPVQNREEGSIVG